VFHELKILPEYFEAVIGGLKSAEVRKNDRDYKVSDYLELKEWDALSEPFTGFTGRIIVRQFTHIADLKDYAHGYVLLSMTPID
jgi:hypothetical protein